MSRDDRASIDPHADAGSIELGHSGAPENVHTSEPSRAGAPNVHTGAPSRSGVPENVHIGELSHVATLELNLLDPAVRSDAERLSALLHPEFIEHGASSRIWTRQEIIEELPLEDATTPRTAASDLVAQHLTDDVILVTYRTTSTTKTAVRSSIWLRSANGIWKMRFHQGTVVPASVEGGNASTVAR